MTNKITGMIPHEILFSYCPRNALLNKLILALHEEKQEDTTTKLIELKKGDKKSCKEAKRHARRKKRDMTENTRSLRNIQKVT